MSLCFIAEAYLMVRSMVNTAFRTKWCNISLLPTHLSRASTSTRLRAMLEQRFNLNIKTPKITSGYTPLKWMYTKPTNCAPKDALQTTMSQNGNLPAECLQWNSRNKLRNANLPWTFECEGIMTRKTLYIYTLMTKRWQRQETYFQFAKATLYQS